MSRRLILIAVTVLVLVIVATSTLFTVRQTEQAIVTQLGEPRRVIQEPGLKMKMPFIQDVRYFDSRLLTFDAASEEIIALDQKRLVIDSFLIYQIVDPLRFFQTVATEAGIRARLNSLLTGALRRVLGGFTLSDMLSAEREQIIETIRDQLRSEGERFGIRVVDFRIKRADLPPQNSQAIYARMNAEREREARELRAQGEELAQRIRARAEREQTILIADARRTSQLLRGEGDAEAVRIYADAFGQDKDFFSFYRSMEAYRKSIDEDTTLVLSPDSDFFRYFGDAAGKQKVKK